jgi:hypothetical protein
MKTEILKYLFFINEDIERNSFLMPIGRILPIGGHNNGREQRLLIRDKCMRGAAFSFSRFIRGKSLKDRGIVF